ncbi:hypothetical protein O3Q51_02330 [Cryomorphaceae bacterium 1068]|nr:hypothetical protein [Cryomorphaceae bacterium 1068]
MDKDMRSWYNANYTDAKYDLFKKSISKAFNHTPAFRLAETPVFFDSDLKEKVLQACEDINKTILQPNFKELTKGAIKHPDLVVPNEDYHTRFLQMDFGICRNDDGEIVPQLIEVQGFPSLYFFQDLLYKAYIENFDIPDEFTVHFDGLDSVRYMELLRKEIVGDFDPKSVVLLEVEPEKQATYIDFLGAEAHLGIKVLCLTGLKKRGKQLFYKDQNGDDVLIQRIYNRVIFDELKQRPDLKREYFFHDEVDVEWVGHPNWFFRISKYTMPLFNSPYVPECYYLDQLSEYPEDLHNYVLKPLYSFAGSGVMLSISAKDLDAIEEKENYILQRKVNYAPLIETPSGPAKCELRVMMIWEKEEAKIKLVNNLVRVSKGEMVGVRYNKDKDWVGASVGFFPR